MTFDEFKKLRTRQDAKDRAWRTFLQNIAVDVAVAGAPVVYDAVAGWNGAFTAAYWVPVGVSLAKTVAVVCLAYVMRLKKPPANQA